MRVVGGCAAGFPALSRYFDPFAGCYLRRVGIFEGMTVRSVGLDIRMGSLQTVHIDYTQNMLDE